MPLGYNKPLYILPFDHRRSFQTRMFGWRETLTQEQTAQIAATKEEAVVQLWIWYPPGRRRTTYFCRGNYGYTCAPLSIL